MSFKEFLEESDILRYIQYKAKESNVSLDEAARQSLSRLFSQFQNAETPIIILTAFRSERTLIANRNLNRQLANDLRALGWGYTPVLGGYLETIADESGQPKQVRVHEESFLVNAVYSKDLINKVTALLKKYEQEAALLKSPNNEEAFLLFANGQTSSVGKWKADPQQMATYYTRMKNGPEGRQFTFEAAGDDSRTTKMAVDFFLKD